MVLTRLIRHRAIKRLYCECRSRSPISRNADTFAYNRCVVKIAADCTHTFLYDAYGNVMGYWDAEGNTVAEYVYDAFGRTAAQNGTMTDVFAIRYSTKYYDAEAGLYYYGKRYYSPAWRRWLTRDPIGEEGGANLYCYLENAPIALYDAVGLYKVICHSFGTPPPVGWSNKSTLAYFSAKFRYPIVRQVSYDNGKIGYNVEFNPKESIFEIFTRLSVTIGALADEVEHLNCAIPYDVALGVFKTEAEAICDCPTMAKKKYNDVAQKLKQAEAECKACNWRLDRKGGPHGH